MMVHVAGDTGVKDETYLWSGTGVCQRPLGLKLKSILLPDCTHQAVLLKWLLKKIKIQKRAAELHPHTNHEASANVFGINIKGMCQADFLRNLQNLVFIFPGFLSFFGLENNFNVITC